jgi:putative membrane protein
LRDRTVKHTAATRAALASAGAVLLVGTPLIFFHDVGPLSQHMVLHILTMNVAAPVTAAWLTASGTARTTAPGWLWLVAAVQILALYFLHTPRFHVLAAHDSAISLAMHGVLAGVAFGFWTTLLRLSDRQQWHAPAALLVTAKLACLLAALLIFSPRLLYASIDHASHAHVNLGDQQLAGLLMIVACPLSYLTAAILLTVDLIQPRGRETAQIERHAP